MKTTEENLTDMYHAHLALSAQTKLLKESLAWTLSVCEELLRDGDGPEQYLLKRAHLALEGGKC
jgi:hypothetical protein